MSKKLLALLTGYVAGSVITSLYADKKGSDVKKTAQSKENTNEGLKYIFSYIFGIQKKFFGDVKENVVSDEKINLVKSKAQELVDLLEEYKIDAQKLVKDVQTKGKEYSENVLQHLDEFSKLKTEEAEVKLKKYGTQVIAEFKKQSKKILGEVTQKAQKTSPSVKKRTPK